jgi:hypothetical protein
VRPSRDEIIETRMLASLALIAEANDRSLVEELNLAVQAYVHEHLPLRAQEQACEALTASRVQAGE